MLNYVKMKLLDVSGQIPIDVNTSNWWSGIFSLDFSIPSEIYCVLDTITNFVGYIMPLYLYAPIITLIIAYWGFLIFKSFIAFCAILLGKITSYISGR